jgi:hypothetical protein
MAGGVAGRRYSGRAIAAMRPHGLAQPCHEAIDKVRGYMAGTRCAAVITLSSPVPSLYAGTFRHATAATRCQGPPERDLAWAGHARPGRPSAAAVMRSLLLQTAAIAILGQAGPYHTVGALARLGHRSWRLMCSSKLLHQFTANFLHTAASSFPLARSFSESVYLR